MTYLGKTALAATFALGALGATAVTAGNGDMDQIKLHLKDGSCLDQAELLLADATLTADQIQQQLRDGSCLLDDTAVDDTVVDDTTDDTIAAVTPLQTRTRTRTGEDNGNGSVSRARNEGGGRN